MIEVELKESSNFDEIELAMIEAGAEDMEKEGLSLFIYTAIESLQRLKENLEKSAFEIKNFGPAYLPTQKTSISDDEKAQYEKLLEALDDQDDVQEIYDNL